MNADFRIIGKPRPQLEGPAKVSGRAAFASRKSANPWAVENA